jgi:1-acyl-sn-glycerol-3-phosphate acyltransferase
VNWARALAFNVVFFAWTGLLGTIAVPVLLMPRKTVMRFGRFWARSVLFLLRTLVGLDHQIVGFDRVPAGGCIIAMKHQSAWDTLISTVAFGDPAPIVKRELLLLPFYGWYAARAGSIGIDRQGGASTVRGMLTAARKAVAEGRPVIIFPQGTRVAPGASMAYQPGVYALYRALSLPLVPAAVNSGVFWGRRSFLKRPGRITLEFLEPIPPGWARRQLMEELERRIETATARLEAEARREGRRIGAMPPLIAGNGAATETSPSRRR